ARNRRRSGGKDSGRGPRLRRGDTIRDRGRCRQPGTTTDFRARRREARPPRLLPVTPAVDRQRCHDRSRCLPEVFAERFCCDGFFCRGGTALALATRTYLPAECPRLALPT